MNNWLRVVLCGSLCAWSAAAYAQGDSVSQTVGHGQIDWSKKTITATGSGAPNLKAPNVAVARLGAERAAKMDALRNVLEAVKGVRVSGDESAGDMMDSAPAVKAKVEGIVRKFKVLDTKYYSDGGVDVVVQVPLDGVLTETLVPDAGSDASSPASNQSGTTGVVINAEGLKVTPALSPRVVDDSGRQVYGAPVVTPAAVKKHGVAGYAGSVKLAMKDGRVGDKPLVVRAQKLTEAGGSDLVVSANDGARLTKLAGLLASGKVIIVTD